MHKISKKLFYTGLMRFFLTVFSLAISPILALKLVFLFYPEFLDPAFNIFIIGSVSVSLLASYFYVFHHYKTVHETIQPMTKLADIGKLASQVVHDLRSPLSSLEVVLLFFRGQKNKDQDFKDHLNLLDLCSKRFQKITEDLLKKYRSQDEKKETFEIHEVLDELVGEYQTQLSFSDIQFHKQYASQSLFIEGNRGHIERACSNIIKNAIEAMSYKGNIYLQTSFQKEKVKVAIQDSGPGLDDQKIQKILKGNFTQGKQDGHGIGLTFVRQVLTEHNGILNITSHPGKGACFEMELPLTPKELTPFTLMIPKNTSVLVIDDDESILEQWRMKLESQGHSVILATSFEDFVSKELSIENGLTAIVDYHFENSETDGLAILTFLKEQGWKNLYLCTAEYWKPSLKQAAKQLGVPLCPKPLPEIKVQPYQLSIVDMNFSEEPKKTGAVIH